MLGLVCSLFGPVAAGAGQEAAPGDSDASKKIEQLFDPGAGSGEFLAIKEHIQSLLKQNQELETRYASLQKESFGLQKKIKQARQEVAALEQEQVRRQERRRQKFDEMLAKAREDPGPIPGLALLQLHDLQYQKKELELGLQLKAAALRESRQDYDRQLAGLQKQLDESKEQEGRLAAQLKDLETKSAAVLPEIDLLKEENARLEGRNKTAVEADRLAARKKAEQLDIARQVRVKEKEKAGLESAIQKLEAELKVSAEGSDNVYFSQESMRETLERVDRENRQLRSELFSLRQKNAAP